MLLADGCCVKITDFCHSKLFTPATAFFTYFLAFVGVFCRLVKVNLLIQSNVHREVTPMAKSKSRNVNKSDRIRELAAKGLNAIEIKQALVKEGVPINPSLIYGVLKRMKKTRRRAKRSAVPARSNSTGGLTAGDISTLAELADKAGGMEPLAEMVQALSRIK
jgi:hypothetical protein